MTPTRAARLSTRSLTISGGPRELVTELTLEFAPGEFVAILGRNGSGKTLTLHALAGLDAAPRGSVRLDGVPLEQLKRRAIAQRLGLLLQDLEESFTTTVLEAVLIGRHPHLALWQWETTADEALALRSLASVGLEHMASRHMGTLSGGEQRRVAVATLLTQEPSLYLLDEPTNHLDPQHQILLLNLFRGLANEGRTVIATLHDPTLAARFADRAVLLFGDGRWQCGATAEVLTADALSTLYLTPVMELGTNGRRVFVTA